MIFNSVDYAVIIEILNSTEYLSLLKEVNALDSDIPYINLCCVADLLKIQRTLETTLAHNRYILDICGLKNQIFSNIKFCSIIDFMKTSTFYDSQKLDINRLLSYSGTYMRRTSMSSQQSFLSCKSQLEEFGFAVIPNVLSSEEVLNIKTILLKRAQLEINQTTAYMYGNNNNLQRIYHLAIKEPSLNYLLVNPLLLTILDYFFDRKTHHDKYYLSTWQSNILHPGAKEQKLHVDSPFPGDLLPEWNSRITVSYVIQDVNEENGATQVVPRSHLLRRVPSSHEQNFNNTSTLIAPVGSMCLWGGYFWHKSGTNKTNQSRYSLLGTFASSMLREFSLEENNPMLLAMLTPATSNELQAILGMHHGIKDRTLLP